MQENSAVECSQGERLKKLRSRLQVEWADLGKRIGISESMCYQVARGSKNLSDLALYRLEEAERAAGISSPKPIISSVESHPKTDSSKKLKTSKSDGGIIVLKEKDMLDLLGCARKLVDSLERALGK